MESGKRLSPRNDIGEQGDWKDTGIVIRIECDGDGFLHGGSFLWNPCQTAAKAEDKEDNPEREIDLSRVVDRKRLACRSGRSGTQWRTDVELRSSQVASIGSYNDED